jgi:hypothetical protein
MALDPDLALLRMAHAELLAPRHHRARRFRDASCDALRIVRMDALERRRRVARERLGVDAVDVDDAGARITELATAVGFERERVHDAGRRRGELREALLLAAQRFVRAQRIVLRSAPLGAVAKDDHDAARCAVGASYRRAAVVDRDLAAVAGDQHDVAREGNGSRGAQNVGHRIGERLARFAMHDAKHVGERFSGSLGRCPSGQPLRFRIEKAHAAVDAGGDDGIADARERHGGETLGGLEAAVRAVQRVDQHAREHADRD